MLARLRFYATLYAQYWGLSRPEFHEFAADIPARLPQRLHVHFWTPVDNAGARVIVHDMLPALRNAIQVLGLQWRVDVSAELPQGKVDWLICFKALPHQPVLGSPRQVLLICDQAEVFWDDLADFDALVATSSRPFAGLLAARHRHTTFISESEPLAHLDMGAANLATWPEQQREPVLLWHGGPYSQDALHALRPVLERFAQDKDAVLHIVSGKAAASEETWGKLRVKRFPWSIEQLQNSAEIARLGIIPARSSLRVSWLKPASRVRFLYALGVPTIGDARVPDVMDFMSLFDGPVAGSDSEWSAKLDEYWESENLASLARAGHTAVREHFTTEHTALQWLHFLAQEAAA